MKKRKVNRAKRIFSSCRNHGSCPACKSSRLHQANKNMNKVKYDELVNIL